MIAIMVFVQRLMVLTSARVIQTTKDLHVTDVSSNTF